MMEMIQEIKNLAEESGAGDLGFCSLSKLAEFGADYEKIARGYPSAVSVIVPLSKGILSEVDQAPTITYFAHYRAVNRLIDEITLKIALYLERHGCLAFAVPASQSDPEDDYAGVFPHKTAAVLSGLGWIGKNALFVHPKFGPAVRLGTVLTTLPAEEKEVLSGQCGDCHLCRDHCPAMAIEGQEWALGMARKNLIDVRACSSYMKENYQMIGRGSVCGLCIAHCPYSRVIKPKKRSESESFSG